MLQRSQNSLDLNFFQFRSEGGVIKSKSKQSTLSRERRGQYRTGQDRSVWVSTGQHRLAWVRTGQNGGEKGQDSSGQVITD